MASYKLYVVVLALVCIALQQEVSCGGRKTQPVEIEAESSDKDPDQATDAEIEASVEEEQVEEGQVEEGQEEEGQEEEGQEEDGQEDCPEYSSKIWNETFGDPNAMALAKLTLNTAKEMSADEVCSDSTRYVLKTAETLATNEHAQYSIRMFFKLMWSIGKKMDMASDKYRETTKVIKRVMTDKEAQDLISNFIARGVNLLKNPETRKRMADMADSLSFMFKPYVEKEAAKNRTNQTKRTFSIN